jgi:hypothetical protein
LTILKNCNGDNHDHPVYPFAAGLWLPGLCVAGAATLQAAQVLWQALVEHIPTQSGAAPYLVNVGSTRTVAMARPLLQWIVDQHLVEVPSPSLRVDVGPVELDPPPAPSTSSGAGGTLLVTAAVVAGLWFAARRA